MHNILQEMQNASHVINLPLLLWKSALPLISLLLSYPSKHQVTQCLEVSDGWMESSPALLLCPSSIEEILDSALNWDS